MEGTKKCKHCQSEMDVKAKVCPNCRKKQSGKGKIIAIVVVSLIVLGAIFGGGDEDAKEAASDNKGSKTESSKESKKPKEKATEKPTEKPIEYTKYSVEEMLDDLDSNAMKAEKKYQDQYVEITGRLSNIDSDGKYISLEPSNDEFTLINVQCFIKSDEQKDKVMEMSKGDKVTLKGKVTSIGEVLGYSINITEIE